MHVTSCSNKFFFFVEGKTNFEIKVIEFIEFTGDLVYEKCPDYILHHKVKQVGNKQTPLIKYFRQGRHFRGVQ